MKHLLTLSATIMTLMTTPVTSSPSFLEDSSETSHPATGVQPITDDQLEGYGEGDLKTMITALSEVNALLCENMATVAYNLRAGNIAPNDLAVILENTLRCLQPKDSYGSQGDTSSSSSSSDSSSDSSESSESNDNTRSARKGGRRATNGCDHYGVHDSKCFRYSFS